MKHTAIINLDAPGPKISKHIYGHFAEHLGRCIYDGFYVGDSDTIPHKKGLRLDVIEAFKNLNIPNLRWPGGCFADEYHWKDGIGPKEQRPEMINTHWGGVVENNHFGTHEFMDLCEELETEPYITGNLGSGSVHEMSQWVEYLTFDGKSPMTELRQKNGRDKPWKVKYWGVGNENWGCGGGMTGEFYADQARRYATYCRSYGDNTLYKIACGPNSDDYNWMEAVMKSMVYCPAGLPADRFVRGVSLHYYTIAGTWEEKGKALEDDRNKWLQIMKRSWFMEELITRHSAVMDRYDPEKKIGMIVDEWGTWHQVEEGTNPGFLYQQNSIRDALSASLQLDIFHNHADRVYMANLAQAVNVLQSPVLTEGDKMILTPTYHVLEMNKEHMDADSLPVFLDTADHKSESEGKEFSTLSMSASRKGKSYLVSMTNLDPEKGKTVTLDLRGEKIGEIKARILSGQRLNSHNSFESPEAVKPEDFRDFELKGTTMEINLPARSFVTFSF
ncbi:MAG: alpha-L-arabinofuranosidase C-terminal domain-containing protein [Spirochaetales bacterium]|nr:alpha-L-arabinofuranosidase C-terminal domain-containing protein [Spirochaetales bacterium]